MAEELHPVTVRISPLAFRILQAHGESDGIGVSTRLANYAEELADKVRHASNLIQRAIESEQHNATPGCKGSKS